MRIFLAAAIFACLLVPFVAFAAPAKPTELPHDAKDTWWPYQPQLKRVSDFVERWDREGLDRLLDSLDTVAKEKHDAQLGRIVRHYRGSALVLRNQYREAESLFVEVAAAARRAGDDRSEVAARFARANMMRSRGLSEEGERELQATIRRGRARGLRFALLPPMISLGYAQFELGRLQDAERTFRRMYEESRAARSEFMRMKAEGGLARCCQALGKLPEAQRWYAAAIRRAKERGLTGELPGLWINLGFIENAIGDPAVAETQFLEALQEADRLGQLEMWASATVECAARRREIGAIDQADSILAAGLARVVGNTTSNVISDYYVAEYFTEFGKVRFAQERSNEGERFLRAAVALTDSLSAFHQPIVLADVLGTMNEHDRAVAALALVDSLLAHGDLANASASPSMDQLHQQRGALLAQLGRARPALQELLPSLQSGHINGAASIAYGSIYVARAYRSLGLADSAAWWARFGIDTLSNGRRKTDDTATLLKADEYASWLGFELAAVELGRSGRPPAVRERAALGELLDLGERTIADRMLSRSRPSARTHANSLTVDRVQREMLRPGEVMLQLAFGNDTTLVFALSRDALQVWYAPSLRRLTPRLDRLERLLADTEATDDSRWEGAARSLGEDLFGPGATLIDGAKTLLLAADRLEGRALEPLVVRGRALDAGRAIAFVPSMRALSILRARTPSPQTGPMSVLGRSRDEGGRPLEGAKREARELSSAYAGVRIALDDRRAAREQLRDPIATSDVLHFATHGKYDRWRPWQSGLLVAPAGGDPWLRASAIVNASVRARLCVMASCRSLGATAAGSSGGLAEAWLLSGVGTVIATRWDVSDAAATEFSLRFYDRLARGDDAATALSSARAALRANPRFRAPRYWAGFVLMGEPATRVKLRPKAGLRVRG